MLLEVSALKKMYRRRGEEFAAVDHVDLKVETGEFVGIIGKSGSGKSTLLNLIAGLLEPTEGTILFNGISYEKMTVNEKSHFRNRKIGFIPQGKSLLNNFTVIDNLRMPLYIFKNKHDAASELLFAEDLLEKIGMKKLADEYPKNLSGGEQRRVAIARALIQLPDLLLADEPTSDLDEVTKKEVLRLFKLFHNSGKSLIMVTHQRDSLELADSVYKMESGVLNEINEKKAARFC